MSILITLFLASGWVPQPPDSLALLCDGARSDSIVLDIVYRGQGETHLSWQFQSTEALWGYELTPSADLQAYDDWLEAGRKEPYESPQLSDLEHRINAAVGGGRLGVIRPLNCLEATLLARQVRLTGPARMREFLAFVLRRDAPARTKIYWLSGPDEFPPKADRIQPLIRQDLEAGWRLHAIVHNHTGPAPVAAPSGSDAHYALSWAGGGAERFIVLGGLRAFDVSAPELRVFMLDEKG